jgi:hypothetical protein
MQRRAKSLNAASNRLIENRSSSNRANAPEERDMEIEEQKTARSEGKKLC